MSNPYDLIDEVRLLEFTETLVSIPSVANNEHEISDWIYDHFKSLGLAGVMRLPVEESGDTVAGWLEGPSDGPTLMFNFHMDTFDAFEGWETDPFKPERKGDRLYGVGSHDMKGGAARARAKAVVSISEPGGIDLGYNEDFGMGGSLCVIGLQGGGTLILVPELAEVYIDRHILPGENVEGAARQIRSSIERASIESSYEVSWDERPTPAPTSFVVPRDSTFVQTLKRNLERETGWDVGFVLGRSVADTNHFAVHGGVPTVILGPTGGNTCEANEYVNISSLVPVARTYVRSALDLLGTIN